MRQARLPQTARLDTGDAALVRRALARDGAAVRAIMQANNRKLYRLARGILLKGNDWPDLWPEIWPLFVFTAIVMTIAVRTYRRTLD